MILEKYLSQKGQFLENNVDLSAGTIAWGLKAKKLVKENPDFINATIGTATEDDGKLMVLPTLYDELQQLTGDQLLAYANMRGQHAFVQAWNRDTLESYPAELRKKTEELSTLPVTACGGLTGGLMLTSQVFFDLGDKLLAPNSRWGNVDNVFFKNQQLHEVPYKLVDQNGNLSLSDLIDNLQSLEKTEKKIGIYLNFPNNPSGISPTLDQVKELQETLETITVPTVLLLDDAYENYCYEDNIVNHSIFPYLVGLNDNVLAVKIDGASKRYCAYGARLGTMTVGFGLEKDENEKSEIRELMVKSARTNSSSAPRGIQEALTNVLVDEKKKTNIQKEKARNLSILSRRYKLIKKLGEETESNILKPVKFNSGFFGYYLIKNQQSATEISSKLLEKGLGTVPFVNISNGLNGIRVAYCSIREEKIEQAIDLLYSQI
ncbi:MAG: LL-diaminopimelate aminotransferase [Candidatus Heimdallarchaeota archaeon AB_125]|nr:MAG: LL-diaminopimelate aminotransferase [Candidatus Heimdallarchaeota archaeon AB_125]